MDQSYLRPTITDTKSKRTKEQVGCYSQVNDTQIEFTKSQLITFKLPKEEIVLNGSWDIQQGYERFRTKTFPSSESTIQNLLLIAVKYESEQKVKKSDVLSHIGFLEDIVIDDKESYDVIWYHNQIVAASRNRRLGQGQLIPYIGIRFEDLLKANDPSVPTPDNYKHYKLLQRGEFGEPEEGFSYLSVAEIDSSLTSKMRIEDYTEMKLMVCDGSWGPLQTADSRTFLRIIADRKYYFGQKLVKWVIQCEYGMSSHLVVGLRDYNFRLRAVHQFDVKKDVVPFLKDRYPDYYAKYAGGAGKLVQVIGWIRKRITYLSKEETGPHVFRLNILGDGLFSFNKVSESESQAIFDNVLIKEFQKWRDEGINILGESELVVKKKAEKADDGLDEITKRLEKTTL